MLTTFSKCQIMSKHSNCKKLRQSNYMRIIMFEIRKYFIKQRIQGDSNLDQAFILYLWYLIVCDTRCQGSSLVSAKSFIFVTQLFSVSHYTSLNSQPSSCLNVTLSSLCSRIFWLFFLIVS